MPITHTPTNPVPPGYQPPGTTGRKVKSGETLASIAPEYGLTWQQLADLNWKTHKPDEINWYLEHNFGCTTVSPDGNNYSFSDDDPGTLWVPAPSGPIPGGGLPGEAGPGDPAPSPDDSEGSGESDPARVARNDVNLLRLPVVRLPVGWRTPQPTAVTRFRLWVPTDSGGILTIKHENGGTVDLRKPFRTVLKPPAAEVTYEVKAADFGEFFVIATGAANNIVTCAFVQISFSRDGAGEADPPLIPWNFYYWPTALALKQSDGSTTPNHWSD
ncbi:MAG: LysM peptidoglycan-binding domain-containing protein, partial [Bryobacteraceae bacterium]